MSASVRWGSQLELDRAGFVLALSIVLSVLYLTRTRKQPSVSRMFIKAGSTALLSAWTLLQGGPFLLAIALGGGSIGDAFLAWDGETPFLCGLGSFLLAHLFYIRLFSRSGEGLKVITGSLIGWRAMVAIIVVAVFAPVMLSRIIPRVGSDLRAPIVVYTTVIVSMVLAALTLDDSDGWVAAGALMFTSSDGILATQKFLVGKDSSHLAWMPYAVWFLYYTGQLIMAHGILSEHL
ncbi:YhhN-like domain containing protein [Naviculisporaceae sp. PSN 640]